MKRWHDEGRTGGARRMTDEEIVARLDHFDQQLAGLGKLLNLALDMLAASDPAMAEEIQRRRQKR